MKILKIVAFALLSLVFVGCGGTQLNPTPESGNSNKYVKVDQYKKGYQDAIKKERLKWKAEGYNDGLKIVKKYANDIKAFEAGKYALKNKFVTYPKLIAQNKNGSINLKSLGCEIRSDMTVNDIFHYYKKNEDTIPNVTDDFFRYPTRKSVNYAQPRRYSMPPRQSSVVQQIDQTIKLPNEHQITNANYIPNNAEQKVSLLTLQKSYKVKDLIDKFSLNCKEGKTNYSCEFATRAEKRWFCKETNICKG